MRWWIAFLLIGQNFLLGLQPQQEVGLLNVQADYQFNQTINITGTLNSPKKVVTAGIVLQYEDGQSYQQQIPLPTDSIFSLTLVPQQVNAIPFSRIYYWFVFAFEDGSSFTSSSYWFDYLDNQFEWHSTSSKWFEVYWSTQETNFGEKIQSIALDGLKSATSLLPISPLLPIKIYVYPDTESLQNAVGSTSKESLSGTALLVSNTILISTSTDLTNTANLERQIPHEITHLLEYQLSQSNYTAVPAWLLEGLATLSENYKDADQSRILKQALDDNALIKIDQLCSSFPSEPGQLTLAYAESASFTQFLIQNYGLDKVTSMLATSGNSLSCQQLVKNTFLRELNDLDSDWKNQSLLQAQPRSNWLEYWPLLLLLLVLAIPLVLIRNHKRSSHRPGEDNDRIK